MTPTEEKMCDLLCELEGADENFCNMCAIECMENGLTEELVEYIEKNHVTKWIDVYRFLFGEPYVDPMEQNPGGRVNEEREKRKRGG